MKKQHLMACLLALAAVTGLFGCASDDDDSDAVTTQTTYERTEERTTSSGLSK
jgi:hypothetical protein